MTRFRAVMSWVRAWIGRGWLGVCRGLLVRMVRRDLLGWCVDGMRMGRCGGTDSACVNGCLAIRAVVMLTMFAVFGRCPAWCGDLVDQVGEILRSFEDC